MLTFAKFWLWFGNVVCYRIHIGDRMRLIKTFVMHLYVDPDAPERLCGNVRLLEDTESHPFKNLQDLDALVRGLVGLPKPADLPLPGEDPLPES
jgi:hypothetical protein